MGLLVECPECKKRNSQKVKTCKCGFILAKFSGRYGGLNIVTSTSG